MLKQNLSQKERVELEDRKYKNIHIIYEILVSPSQQIIWGIREKELKNWKTWIFFNINRACLKRKVISRDLFNQIDKVRKLRNKLHIGSLKEIEKTYSKKEIIYALKVFNQVIKKARSLINEKSRGYAPNRAR